MATCIDSYLSTSSILDCQNEIYLNSHNKIRHGYSISNFLIQWRSCCFMSQERALVSFLTRTLRTTGPFVNLGIGTLALELELELELILQTPLFSVPQGLWTPSLAGWSLRMRGPHPQSHVVLWYCGHVTNKKQYISTLTRPMDHKFSIVVT